MKKANAEHEHGRSCATSPSCSLSLLQGSLSSSSLSEEAEWLLAQGLTETLFELSLARSLLVLIPLFARPALACLFCFGGHTGDAQGYSWFFTQGSLLVVL